MSRTNDIPVGAAAAPPVELSETRLDVPFTVVNVVTTAAACVLPFYFYSRSAVAAFLVFYTVTGLGLTLGYHRLFAHRAFEVPRWLAHVIAVCGYLAIQRGPIFWVAGRKKHPPPPRGSPPARARRNQGPGGGGGPRFFWWGGGGGGPPPPPP